MTIEPHQAHTVCIRAALPPKPAPRVLAPKVDHEEDARLIGKRFHKAFGFSQPIGAGAAANTARIAAAKRARDVMADRVAELLSNGQRMTAPDMRRLLATSQNHLRVVLTEMRAAGRVTGTKGPRGVFLWAINEGAI